MKQNDINAIAEVHRRAFGPDEGPETAQLARDFLSHTDTISISVERDAQIAGNVLFSRFVFADHPQAWMACDLTDGSPDNLGGPPREIPRFMQPHWWDTTGRG